MSTKMFREVKDFYCKAESFCHNSSIQMPKKPNQPNLDPVKYVSENPGDHVALNAVRYVSDFSRNVSKRIMGQINIESEGDPTGVNVFFGVYPGGDFYCWFHECHHLFLVVLVNDKLKTIKAVPFVQGQEFKDAVQNVVNQLNIKHHYPIESADTFVPSNPTADNREG